MIIIKSYTDLEQSKKLAEILPLESADMYYSSVPVREWKDKEDRSKGTHIIFKDQIFALENLRSMEICEGDTYAWSLAALLEYLKDINSTVYIPMLYVHDNKWMLQFVERGHGNIAEVECNNPIDACYEMVLRLHEQKLL